MIFYLLLMIKTQREREREREREGMFGKVCYGSANPL
jgi:hypothetical protein